MPVARLASVSHQGANPSGAQPSGKSRANLASAHFQLKMRLDFSINARVESTQFAVCRFDFQFFRFSSAVSHRADRERN